MIEGFHLNMSKIVLCKVMLVDNVLDEIEWQREDHCRVLFRADAVQRLGGEGDRQGDDHDDHGDDDGEDRNVIFCDPGWGHL